MIKANVTFVFSFENRYEKRFLCFWPEKPHAKRKKIIQSLIHLLRCAEQDKNGILRRELAKGSLEVYPISNYGAVEIGVHNFYRTLTGQKEKLTAVAKFMNIWEEKNGHWKISRIISYAHEELK
jgi:hypothetical protein